MQRSSARVVEPCVVSGCSGQICAREPLFSTCEWRPEYACFASATCAPQMNGACGWTMTDELRACLGAHLTVRHGDAFVRKVVVAVVLALVVKVGRDALSGR